LGRVQLNKRKTPTNKQHQHNHEDKMTGALISFAIGAVAGIYASSELDTEVVTRTHLGNVAKDFHQELLRVNTSPSIIEVHSSIFHGVEVDSVVVCVLSSFQTE